MKAAALRSAPVRAFKLIRRESAMAILSLPELPVTPERDVESHKTLVWQPRPEWLRKPRSRKNLWN